MAFLCNAKATKITSDSHKACKAVMQDVCDKRRDACFVEKCGSSESLLKEHNKRAVIGDITTAMQLGTFPHFVRVDVGCPIEVAASIMHGAPLVPAEGSVIDSIIMAVTSKLDDGGKLIDVVTPEKTALPKGAHVDRKKQKVVVRRKAEGMYDDMKRTKCLKPGPRCGELANRFLGGDDLEGMPLHDSSETD